MPSTNTAEVNRQLWYLGSEGSNWARSLSKQHLIGCQPDALSMVLQDKAEPPVYVSDRRFMKSINSLQVAAYADGRDEVRGL